MSTNWETFDKILEKAEKSISIRILGQDSGSAKGTMLGSAKDSAKGKIRDDYRKMDEKTLAETLLEQMVYWWTLYNYGDIRLIPELHWDVEPAEDEKDETQALANLATALPNLAAARADIIAILERHGVPTLE